MCNREWEGRKEGREGRVTRPTSTDIPTNTSIINIAVCQVVTSSSPTAPFPPFQSTPLTVIIPCQFLPLLVDYSSLSSSSLFPPLLSEGGMFSDIFIISTAGHVVAKPNHLPLVCLALRTATGFVPHQTYIVLPPLAYEVHLKRIIITLLLLLLLLPLRNVALPHQ